MRSSRCRRWSQVGNVVAVVIAAWAGCDCGGSGLRTKKVDGGGDAPSGGAGGTNPIPGSVDAAGGVDVTGVWWDGGPGGQGGIVTTTGGVSGRDGAIDLPMGGRGGGDGGVLGTGGFATGGATASGGRTGAGGTFNTGGRTSTGGATSSGGRTSTGGTTGSGGRTSTGGTTGVGIDASTGIAATLLQPLAKAFCATARTCCRRDTFYEMDLDDCEAKLPARLLPSVLIDQGTVVIDATRLAACVSAYEAAATTCTITGVESACQGVWVGTRQEGQPCGGSIAFGAFDCIAVNGSAACYWSDANRYPTAAGVCVASPRGKAGEPCSKSCKTGEDCIVDLVGGSAPLPVMCFEDDGLYCAVSANPPVCKPILKAGDSCPHDPGACGRANYCEWPSEVCRPSAKLGESCAEGYCADGLRCASDLRCAETMLVSSTVCKGTPALP